MLHAAELMRPRRGRAASLRQAAGKRLIGFLSELDRNHGGRIGEPAPDFEFRALIEREPSLKGTTFGLFKINDLAVASGNPGRVGCVYSFSSGRLRKRLERVTRQRLAGVRCRVTLWVPARDGAQPVQIYDQPPRLLTKKRRYTKFLSATRKELGGQNAMLFVAERSHCHGQVTS